MTRSSRPDATALERRHQPPSSHRRHGRIRTESTSAELAENLFCAWDEIREHVRTNRRLQEILGDAEEMPPGTREGGSLEQGEPFGRRCDTAPAVDPSWAATVVRPTSNELTADANQRRDHGQLASERSGSISADFQGFP